VRAPWLPAPRDTSRQWARGAELIDSSFQVRELARTGLGVVRDHETPAWTIGFGLDAIRVGYTPTCRHEVETLFKYFAAGECQNSVDSIRRKQM
jgi:hypothetical protein